MIYSYILSVILKKLLQSCIKPLTRQIMAIRSRNSFAPQICANEFHTFLHTC